MRIGLFLNCICLRIVSHTAVGHGAHREVRAIDVQSDCASEVATVQERSEETRYRRIERNVPEVSEVHVTSVEVGVRQIRSVERRVNVGASVEGCRPHVSLVEVREVDDGVAEFTTEQGRPSKIGQDHVTVGERDLAQVLISQRFAVNQRICERYIIGHLYNIEELVVVENGIATRHHVGFAEDIAINCDPISDRKTERLNDLVEFTRFALPRYGD